MQTDNNNKWTGGGLVQGTPDMVLPFAVNPITGALLIEIIPKVLTPTAITSEAIPIDANRHQCGAGVTDDANELIYPVTLDDIGGFPCLRIEKL